MDGQRRRDRVRSFALGGVVGASAALAAFRRSRPAGKPAGRRATTAGLAAFEDAPCYRELVDFERLDDPR